MNPEDFETYFSAEDEKRMVRNRAIRDVIRVVALVLAALLISVLSACSMRNEEIIAQVKLCRDNGLDPVEVQNQITSQITDVICMVPR